MLKERKLIRLVNLIIIKIKIIINLFIFITIIIHKILQEILFSNVKANKKYIVNKEIKKINIYIMF
jgi:hypothetical protein